MSQMLQLVINDYQIKLGGTTAPHRVRDELSRKSHRIDAIRDQLRMDATHHMRSGI
jgi:hypothetical protein